MMMRIVALALALVTQIGTHTENGVSTPLYAIADGNVAAAAQRAADCAALNPAEGNCIGADIYTHSGTRWQKAVFIRPETLNQWLDKQDHPEYWTWHLAVDNLPPPANRIPASDLAKIDYVVQYYDNGSTQIVLRPGVTKQEAECLRRYLEQ